MDRGDNSYIDTGDFRESINLVRTACRIIITAHPKPDGDALGSAIGLKHTLEKAGKNVAVTGLEPLPGRYKSFVQPGDIIPVADALEISPDLIIALDAGALERIPKELQELKGHIKIINIDHHISNKGFGDINIIDAEACSTGEIIYRWIMAAEYKMDKITAQMLWIAILTDTGRFAYSNTTPRALRVAAELLEYGINTEDIDRRIYRQLSREELQIRKAAMQSIQFRNAGRIAFASLTTDDFDTAGCTVSETEDIVDIPRSIDGVNVAMLFYEDIEKPGRINVSARSDGSCNLAEICGNLGGGGHAKAAGCRIRGSMTEVQETVLHAVGAALH